MNKIIVIVGPTASGKTKLSVEIAKAFDGECLNFDSTQLFCGTDIATNKITEEEEENIKHHLLSIKKIDEEIDVVEFRNIARKLINELLNKKIVPILVGGTGYYLLGIVKNYSFAGSKRSKSSHDDFLSLNEADLENLKKDNSLIKGTDNKRLIRKLELKNANYNIDKNKEESYYYDNLIFIGLNPDRKLLYERIDNRVEELIKIGLFDEIKKAYLDVNKNRNAQSLKCIGGKEIIAYLENEITYDECVNLMKKNNRNYAKRQMTYFRKKFENNIKWFDHSYKDFDVCVKNIIKYLIK